MLVSPISVNHNRYSYSCALKKNADLNKATTPAYANSTVEYASVPFYGAVKVKSINSIIQQKHTKLLKQIDDILEAISAETVQEDIVTKSLQTIMAFIKNIERQKDRLWQEAEELDNNKTLNPFQKNDIANRLRKEYKRLENARPVFKEPTKPDPKLSKIDYELLNKFKSAILNENYDLELVFFNHYKALGAISSVDELKEHFPKISVPADPVKVVAAKIAATITRDFYEEFDEYFMACDWDGQGDFALSKVMDLCDKHAHLFGIEGEMLFRLIAPALSEKIVETFENIKVNDKFSSIPEKRKSDLAQISKDDKTLIFFDYDDFVLNTVKRIYLMDMKFNEMGCNLPDGSVYYLNTVKDNCYKFEKIPEKIKTFIKMGQELFKLQRDYDKFSLEELKARLMFYANREIGNDEVILENIIDFDACDGTQSDIVNMKKFLSLLDNFSDGRISKQDIIQTVEQEKIYPEAKTLVDIDEKNSVTEKFKAEQKKLAELNKQQEIFDSAMNILYSNNLNTIAATLSSKYRPCDLEDKTLERANYLNNLIFSIADKKDGNLNKAFFESQILRWDTYNQYEASGDALFIEAQNYAKKQAGEIDINRAGQYIINMNLLNNYPKCVDYHKYGVVIQRIMEKVGCDKTIAVEYLNKFDEYLELEADEKSQLANILNIFSIKDSVDKSILKYVIENDYVNIDTTVTISFNNSGVKNTLAAICASAKQQVLDKYKFPGCLPYLLGFEEALSSVANTTGSSGIKQTGRNNNALAYKMELKLAGQNNRLFSSKNDFRFDIFSEKGLH